ncbi:MAG: DUF6519 domain-containing protein [Acidobacteriota bacterium]
MSHKRLPGRLDGDFSKIRIDGEGRDSAVRLLQGRVILDSDWNLQAEIFTRRRRRGFADLIGPAGAPADQAGFGLVAESQLRFDGESSVAVIGGDGVDVWGSEAGACVELIFTPSPGRGGVLLGRFSRRADDGFGHDLSLVLEADGRLVAHAEGASLEAPMPARWGRRNHVALSWRPGHARWWVNGHSAAGPAELPLHRAPTVAVLGAALRSGEVTQAYAGGLHDVRFWSEERTDAQVHAGADAEALDPSSATLAGWWHFDRPSSGLEVPDRARHGVPAVLGGGQADRAPRRHVDRLRVTPGRFWVEGMLCQRSEVEVLESPTVEELGAGTWLFYLEAAETLVTAAQDPKLIEPALGGADTSGRSRVVNDVRALRLGEPVDPADGDAVLERWRRFEAAASRRGTLLARRRGDMVGVDIGNLLYRVEVRSDGAFAGSPWAGGAGEHGVHSMELLRAGEGTVPGRARLQLDTWPGAEDLAPDGGPQTPWRVGDALELRGEPSEKSGEVDLLYAAVTAVDPSNRRLEVEADGVERFTDLVGLAARRLATWAWSRDNGSVLFTVERVDPDGLSVQLMTSVRQFELRVDEWVEWVTPDRPLEPGTLHRVVAVDRSLGKVELDPPVTPAPAGSGPPPRPAVLRLWNQQPLEGAPLVAGAALMVFDQWQPLESGVEVRFSGDGPYRAGDYWWLPARTALSDIEWPRGRDGKAKIARGEFH